MTTPEQKRLDDARGMLVSIAILIEQRTAPGCPIDATLHALLTAAVRLFDDASEYQLQASERKGETVRHPPVSTPPGSGQSAVTNAASGRDPEPDADRGAGIPSGEVSRR